MNMEKFWQEFNALPPEAQKQVVDFIAFLKSRYKQPRPGKPSGDLAGEIFVGIWKDRSDMQDSGAWVRAVRDKEWGKEK